MTRRLSLSVDELDLSVRSYNCLKNAEIRTIRELVQKTEPELLRLKNFGRKCLNEIKDLLGEMDLHLGMSLDEFKANENEIAWEKAVVPAGWHPAFTCRGDGTLIGRQLPTEESLTPTITSIDELHAALCARRPSDLLAQELWEHWCGVIREKGRTQPHLLNLRIEDAALELDFAKPVLVEHSSNLGDQLLR